MKLTALLLCVQKVLAALRGDMSRERQSVWRDVVAAAATTQRHGTQEDLRAKPTRSGVCAEPFTSRDTDWRRSNSDTVC